MKLRTCVALSGEFVFGIHTPSFRVRNLRERDYVTSLGTFGDGQPRENQENFPDGDVEEPRADPIFEVPNPFPFRGATYIIKRSADRKAEDPASISLPAPVALSFSDTVRKWLQTDDLPEERLDALFQGLPEPLQLALATNSTDPEDLTRMAEWCCSFLRDSENGRPVGLIYKEDQGRVRPEIKNHALFEVLANNPHLPDDYKQVMVLMPGAQGNSEIMGEWSDQTGESHVFEYLRRNSYIAWGHYAANMAHDAIRYRTRDLTPSDMSGMRHLYYQRTYVRLADELGIAVPAHRRRLDPPELEALRRTICEILLSEERQSELSFSCTLWGWNFGFDHASSGYRLHGSHQQVHQQFALIPREVSPGMPDMSQGIPPYACGDLVGEFVRNYKEEAGVGFFDAYIKAIRGNRRMDGDEKRERSLVIHEADGVMVFVPKAQTSQWEIQVMPVGPVGNILEADTRIRHALDRAMRIAINVLGQLGARMVTTIEYAKRFDSPDIDQRLLYSFLPKLPESPGAFTEAQLRWINGHYPEDFAIACRNKVANCKRSESEASILRFQMKHGKRQEIYA